MLQVTTVTQKGQVTVPNFIRQKLGLEPGSKVLFQIEGKKITLSPLPSFFNFKGSIKSNKVFDIKKMRSYAKKDLIKKYAKTS